MIHRTQLPPEASRLVRAADGSHWRTAGHTATGEQLYVLDGVDVDTCPMWVREREALLVELTGGPLAPVDEGAAA
ncbi:MULTISPECIES: hypothetical protein [Streptomyces]|uniref:Uncharacterized protein n=2 Tax=root TaxID=1 RepID=F2R676_STRVP|nr:hypothetical protein [Streptomyces venezuelae]YP_010754248.1 hypothetical protein QEH31_gp36 [Streptomyces phage Chymera]AMS01595.1 hypothetical protein SEA_CHYMERA_36 [Streptomyces phage Chymera]APE22014.1 hypothetical protein vnz_13965 [Streptomyces venezuelae]QER99405.1 hypothetical protein DEJ43_14145 [Streptomyces venezuelae ATCC 10712]CCA56127.1 hypothetical protein SVEN_2841 [Streptomyces venezuelae ATCC 10712]